jgi:hypothetical protein
MQSRYKKYSVRCECNDISIFDILKNICNLYSGDYSVEDGCLQCSFLTKEDRKVFLSQIDLSWLVDFTIFER